MRSCAQISKSQFSEYQNVLFFKRSTNVVSCTSGFEGAALKAAVEQLKKTRKKKEETFLLPADFFLTWMGSMMRSQKDVEEDS